MRAKLVEIIDSLWNNFAEKADYDPTSFLASNGDIKENFLCN